jgi:EAL domain-containing protein (putative c-di-GMP-specific phosphodiesterase class I)
LELTESTVIEDVDLVIRRLKSLKTLGFQLSIDDFGVGYSSLSNFHAFPFDILKLDRSFIRGINVNHKNAAIAQAIITMAHQLNLKVVAEGVETETELDFLCQNNCDEMQGYLFSPPIPANEFVNLLKSNRRLMRV